MSLLEASVPAFCLASGRRIELTHPMVMGVINVSPNSFFAATPEISYALRQVEQMVQAGVDIVDVGPAQYIV